MEKDASQHARTSTHKEIDLLVFRMHFLKAESSVEAEENETRKWKSRDLRTRFYEFWAEPRNADSGAERVLQEPRLEDCRRVHRFRNLWRGRLTTPTQQTHGRCTATPIRLGNGLGFLQVCQVHVSLAAGTGNIFFIGDWLCFVEGSN
jgi:hypothetical protein